MPRKGYFSLTLPEEVYRTLAEKAKKYGTTPQRIIRIAAFDETFLGKVSEKDFVGSNPTPRTNYYRIFSKKLKNKYESGKVFAVA